MRNNSLSYSMYLVEVKNYSIVLKFLSLSYLYYTVDKKKQNCNEQYVNL